MLKYKHAHPFNPAKKNLQHFLRTYPPRFAAKLARLYPRFCSRRTLWFGTELEESNWELGLRLFATMCWETTDWWNDAALKSVFAYLRGSRDLRLGSMRHLFPTKFSFQWLVQNIPVMVCGAYQLLKPFFVYKYTQFP